LFRGELAVVSFSVLVMMGASGCSGKREHLLRGVITIREPVWPSICGYLLTSVLYGNDHLAVAATLLESISVSRHLLDAADGYRW